MRKAHGPQSVGLAFVLFSSTDSLQKQGGLPADALGVGLQLFQRAILNLTHPLLRNTKQVADLAQAVGAVARQAEAEVEYLPLAGAEVFHQEAEGLLTLVVLLHHQRAGV